MIGLKNELKSSEIKIKLIIEGSKQNELKSAKSDG
jgi:hypothetical protein